MRLLGLSGTTLTRCLLGFSVFLFVVRAIQFLLIGSVFPAVFLLVFVLVIAVAAAIGEKTLRGAVRLWGSFLILYALSRFFFAATVWFGFLDEAYVVDAITVWFVLLTVFYMYAGIALVMKPRLGLRQGVECGSLS